MTPENWNTFILGILPIISIAVTGGFTILTLWVKSRIDANAKAQLEMGQLTHDAVKKIETTTVASEALLNSEHAKLTTEIKEIRKQFSESQLQNAKITGDIKAMIVKADESTKLILQLSKDNASLVEKARKEVNGH